MTEKIVKIIQGLLDSGVTSREQFSSVAYGNGMTPLLKEIHSISEFEIFSKMQRLGNRYLRVGREDLVFWLIERSQTVGAQQALQDALNYARATQVEVYDLVLLDTVYIDPREFRFCNGVTIAMLEKIPNQRFSIELNRAAFSGGTPGAEIVSILYVSNSQPVSHPCSTATEGGLWESVRYNPKISDLTDVIHCLTLTRAPDSSLQGTAYGTFCKDDQPFVPPWDGWYLLQPRPRRLGQNLRESELSAADEILRKWRKLDTPLKEKLKVPLSRLGNFCSGISDVDKAIELRICIDALFGSDGERNDLSYRAGIRAANFLNEVDKRATFEAIKSAYRVGSNAAHTGELKKKSDIDELMKAAVVVKNAILKTIDEGPVDWSSVELGLSESPPVEGR